MCTYMDVNNIICLWITLLSDTTNPAWELQPGSQPYHDCYCLWDWLFEALSWIIFLYGYGHTRIVASVMKITNFVAWLNYLFWVWLMMTLLIVYRMSLTGDLFVFSESYVDSFYAAPTVTSIYSFEMNSEFPVMFYSSDIASMQIVIYFFFTTSSALKNCVSASYKNGPCCNERAS